MVRDASAVTVLKAVREEAAAGKRGEGRGGGVSSCGGSGSGRGGGECDKRKVLFGWLQQSASLLSSCRCGGATD